MSLVVNNSGADKLQGFLTRAQNKLREQNELAYEHCVKADALRIKNYFLESIDEYIAAISYDENSIDAFKGLGLSYRQVGLVKSAIESFEKAKKIAPFDKSVRYELGCTYTQGSEFEKALKEFKSALKIDPEYIDAQFNLAITHELANEIDLAIAIYNKIIEQRPSYITAYHNLGSLYMRLGHNQYAIEVFKALLKINPEFTRAYLGIAIAYDKMENASRALRYYKKYMTLKPNSANIPYIKERVYSIRLERPKNPGNLKLV